MEGVPPVPPQSCIDAIKKGLPNTDSKDGLRDLAPLYEKCKNELESNPQILEKTKEMIKKLAPDAHITVPSNYQLI